MRRYGTLFLLLLLLFAFPALAETDEQLVHLWSRMRLPVWSCFCATALTSSA